MAAGIYLGKKLLFKAGKTPLKYLQNQILKEKAKLVGAGAISGWAATSTIGHVLHDKDAPKYAEEEKPVRAAILQVSKKYRKEWEKKGASEEDAKWLALIDIGYDKKISKSLSEKGVLPLYQKMLKESKVSPLDVKKHVQKREQYGMSTKHINSNAIEKAYEWPGDGKGMVSSYSSGMAAPQTERPSGLVDPIKNPY